MAATMGKKGCGHRQQKEGPWPRHGHQWTAAAAASGLYTGLPSFREGIATYETVFGVSSGEKSFHRTLQMVLRRGGAHPPRLAIDTATACLVSSLPSFLSFFLCRDMETDSPSPQ
jgi:hypothetical protein